MNGNKDVNWTPKTLALLGTMSDSDVAKRIGNTTMQIVQLKRIELGIPRFSDRLASLRVRHWPPKQLAMLGFKPDAEVARITDRSIAEIVAKREELGR
jgi:hypothetical protein